MSWDQVILNVSSTGVAAIGIILNQYWNRRKARREQEARDERIRAEQNRRHKENQDKLDGIIKEQQYLEPHDHIEETGTLKVTGIIRRKPNGQ